jgi:transposase
MLIILNRYQIFLNKFVGFIFLFYLCKKKMRLLKIEPYLSELELKNIMNSQKSIRDFKDWQIIYSVLVNSGKKALDIANILCVTENKIYKTVEKYNKFGASWKTNVQWGGRREERCIMTLEKEKEFLQNIETEAINGQIITYLQIKSKIETELNRIVSDDYIWDMFKRHKWTKKAPRQTHPKADKEAQEEYKKNSQRIWLPNR